VLRWFGLATLLCLSSLPALPETAAVLPFTNASAGSANPQSNLDWIGESIAETVREALAAHGLVTLERSDTQDAYHKLGLRELGTLTQASVIKIGETLDAEHVVYGSFQFTPSNAPQPAAVSGAFGSLKISGRIVDLRHMRLAPELTETGALEDLGTLQAHLTWRILGVLAPNLAPPETDFRTLRLPIRLDAEENYIRGLLAHDPEQKEKFLEQAARLDPRAFHAVYELGKIYYDRKEYREAADLLQRVGQEDIHYREASFLLGLAQFQSGDYAGAQKAFQVILSSVPLSEVFNDLAAAESRRDLPQAADDFRKALDGDATDPVYHFNLGYALWKKGDFAAAAERFRAVLDRDPEDHMATLLLGRCLKKQGLHAGDPTATARLQGLERLKTNYEERAYWQLKSVLAPAAPPEQSKAPPEQGKAPPEQGKTPSEQPAAPPEITK
jgi:tetratricopeptide (TPR) repeat protein